jgi:hypothetical protein
MSTSSQTEDKNSIATPEKSENLANEFLEIPACRIEDVDRALFNLFDKDLPLTFTHRNDTKRIPIVFATGERFALIARKKPLRDRGNALILPVISIMRSNLAFGSDIGMATAPDIRQVIKKQLGKEDSVYQRIVNKMGLQNADDLASPSAFIDEQNEQGAAAGRIATRRNGVGSPNSEKIQEGSLLDAKLGNNVYEIYEMPAPVYFVATYDVTIWTQYTQEMNNVLSAIAAESHFNAVKSYRIETSKGYKFVAYFDNSIGLNNNFDDFSDDERIVRSTLSVKVPGYLLGNSYDGASNKIRKFVSAPQVSFDIIFGDDLGVGKIGIPSGNPGAYVTSDQLTVDDSVPGQFIAENVPLLNPKGIQHSIGGYTLPATAVSSPDVKIISSPFAGDSPPLVISVAKTSTTKQGETTFRQIA